MTKKRALGKGLGALLPDNFETNIVEENNRKSRITHIDINLIKPNKSQPRTFFNQDRLTHLADSIKENGVLQPIIIKELGEGYEIVAGERRWRASMDVGLTEMPSIVMNESEEKLFEISLIENLQREDLNPLEEAYAYKTLMESYEFTQEKVSKMVGKSRSHIANVIRLINLSNPVKDMIVNKELTGGHGRCLVILEPNEQFDVACLAIEKEFSVRELERHIAGLKKEKQNKVKPSASPQFKHFEEQLSELFGTKVEIENGKRKGRIKIEFYTDSDLERLYYLLNKE